MRLLLEQALSNVVFRPTDFVQRERCGDNKLFNHILQDVGGYLDPEIDLTVWASKKGCAIDDTRQPLCNFWIKAQIRINSEPTHAVTQQEARKVWFNLLEQCVHLVVKLFD